MMSNKVRMLDISLGSGHSIFEEQVDDRKSVHTGCQRTRDGFKTLRTELCHTFDELLPSRRTVSSEPFTEGETWVNHVTQRTK
jgi:hypothetical protein